MSSITKKDVESVFEKIYEDFASMNYSQKLEILKMLEKKANTFDEIEVESSLAIAIAFEKIKYYFARIYSEGKAKSTLVNLKRSIDSIDNHIFYYTNYDGNEDYAQIIKELITHLQISMHLDVSFHTTLISIYEQCLEKENVYLKDIQEKYQIGDIPKEYRRRNK
jgi:hypothetical protein